MQRVRKSLTTDVQCFALIIVKEVDITQKHFHYTPRYHPSFYKKIRHLIDLLPRVQNYV